MLLHKHYYTDMRIKVLSSGCWKKGNKSLGNLIELETDIDGAKHSIGDIKQTFHLESLLNAAPVKIV